MTPDSRRTVVRGAAAAVLTALLLSTFAGFRRYWSNRQEHERLSQRVLETEAVVEQKRALLALSQKDDALLEGEARRQLGLIGDGEIEFRFVPSGGPDGERMEAVAPKDS